jgi:transcriptional regulator with XRE-family HTH domain
MSDIRDRIKNERDRLGITQAEAGERLGMTQQGYANLERRTTDPRLSTIVALVGLGMRAEKIVPELARR